MTKSYRSMEDGEKSFKVYVAEMRAYLRDTMKWSTDEIRTYLAEPYAFKTYWIEGYAPAEAIYDDLSNGLG